MNRRNLLIVAAAFVVLSIVMWCSGHARYGHWSEREMFCFQQERQYTQQATAAAAGNDTVGRSVDIDMTVEWGQKREAARQHRLALLWMWNVAAAMVGGAAGLVGVVWFITVPRRRSSAALPAGGAAVVT